MRKARGLLEGDKGREETNGIILIIYFDLQNVIALPELMSPVSIIKENLIFKLNYSCSLDEKACRAVWNELLSDGQYKNSIISHRELLGSIAYKR
jgi:hypothetical protein